MEALKTRFILKGFSHVMDVRVFEFESVARVDAVRTQFTVRIDIALARKYGIRLQDLPLLCSGVLDQCGQETDTRAFTCREAEMRVYANTLAARLEAARHKKGPRSPSADYSSAPEFLYGNR